MLTRNSEKVRARKKTPKKEFGTNKKTSKKSKLTKKAVQILGRGLSNYFIYNLQSVICVVLFYIFTATERDQKEVTRNAQRIGYHCIQFLSTWSLALSYQHSKRTLLPSITRKQSSPGVIKNTVAQWAYQDSNPDLPDSESRNYKNANHPFNLHWENTLKKGLSTIVNK